MPNRHETPRQILAEADLAGPSVGTTLVPKYSRANTSISGREVSEQPIAQFHAVAEASTCQSEL